MVHTSRLLYHAFPAPPPFSLGLHPLTFSFPYLSCFTVELPSSALSSLFPIPLLSLFSQSTFLKTLVHGEAGVWIQPPAQKSGTYPIQLSWVAVSFKTWYQCAFLHTSFCVFLALRMRWWFLIVKPPMVTNIIKNILLIISTFVSHKAMWL